MKRILPILLLTVLITVGCSRSSEAVEPETAADIPDTVIMETIVQEETVSELETPETETVLEIEEETTKMDEILTAKEPETQETEEDTETEDLEAFDDSLSETCEHDFCFSDTYIDEEGGDVWLDLYICDMCGLSYTEPHTFEEETEYGEDEIEEDREDME